MSKEAINLGVVEITVIFYFFPTKTEIALVSLRTRNSSNPPLPFQQPLTCAEVCAGAVGSALAQLMCVPALGRNPPRAENPSVGWALQSEQAVKAERRPWHSWDDVLSFQYCLI